MLTEQQLLNNATSYLNGNTPSVTGLSVDNSGYLNIPNGTRSITVTDAVTGSPIQNATIQIFDTTTNTAIGSPVSTNAFGTGSFTFNNVKIPSSDNLVVNVSASGYYTSQTSAGGDGSNFIKLNPLSVSNNSNIVGTNPTSNTTATKNYTKYILIGSVILILVIGTFIITHHKK